jgi:hypothetical protein
MAYTVCAADIPKQYLYIWRVHKWYEYINYLLSFVSQAIA